MHMLVTSGEILLLQAQHCAHARDLKVPIEHRAIDLQAILLKAC